MGSIELPYRSMIIYSFFNIVRFWSKSDFQAFINFAVEFENYHISCFVTVDFVVKNSFCSFIC